MRKDATEFYDSLASSPTHQDFKIAKRAAAYNAFDIDKVDRIDEREE